MAKLTPHEAMAMAIEQGKRGAGFVSPNPLVGCVILDRDGNLIASGYHERLGEGHAEVNALKNVADPKSLEGAHMYVTLEPCAHEGRTPSCAKAVAKLPIASVTYGLRDPNPLVLDQGAAILRAAGKKVELFTGLQSELRELTEIFLTNMTLKRPFVAVKVASSLDGRIALQDGSSQWITGESSREHVHYLRGCYDAVLTGVGTFLRDNPRLNSRHPSFESKKQKIVLLDPTGRSFPHLAKSALVSVRAPEDIVIVTGPMGQRPPLGKHLEIPDADGAFDMPALLEALRSEGLHSIFVEAGAYTSASFIKSKFADRLYLFMAPKILGEGLSWTAGMTLGSLDHAVNLRENRIEKFGEDFLLTGRLV